MQLHTHLICFAKAPEPGTVKTRLAKDIGNENALHIYEMLLKRTAQACHQWTGPVTVMRTGNDVLFNASALAPFNHQQQCSGDLGQRLLHATTLMQLPIVIIGTDCPDISAQAIRNIAEGLQTADVSFGPSPDGGYWCIAIKTMAAANICFDSSLPWSQDNLLSTTTAALNTARIAYHIGIELNDIDTESDLKLAQSKGFPSIVS